MSAQAAAILRAMADLSPSGEQKADAFTIPLEWFRWLPLTAANLFYRIVDDPAYMGGVEIDWRYGERLAAVDQIRPLQHSLRAGWLFVAGRHEGKRVFHPLVTTAVKVVRGLAPTQLTWAGDIEITPLVSDTATRARFEDVVEIGGGSLAGVPGTVIPDALLKRLPRLQAYANELARAAGFAPSQLVAAQSGPEALMRARDDGVVIVAGFGAYAAHETGGTSKAASLEAWAQTVAQSRQWTAFHAHYVDDERPAATPATPATDHDPVESPYLLTPAQHDAVLRARTDPVTVISGAPGTGKSHAVVAIAADALARDQSVLVAAKTDAAVDALIDLLERAPTADPVVFGSNERKDALARRLSGGQLSPWPDADFDFARQDMDDMVRRRQRIRSQIEERLRAEQLLHGEDADTALARERVPALFDSSTDFDAVADALGATGFFARRRARKTLRRLGAPEHIAHALPIARAVRTAESIARHGGVQIGAAWDELLRADDAARLAVASWLEADSRSARRLNRSSLQAIAAVATALRSGRAARREQLRRIDSRRLTTALPLWIGTLPDIDDLLPAVPGLFDLVVLDEASSIDQPLAAPALLRAKRAVVAGDPHQLRHVSFLSDARMADAVAAHGLAANPTLAARLDVRRNSAFDAAVGVAPVVTLDEHFRSNPHLVEFVARRVYGGRVQVATRSPRTECVDCVDVRRVEGKRDDAGVVQAEVDAVVNELRRLHRSGVRSVGVVTPFRAQADALEHAVLASFNADELERMDLRVGTVHAQQGNERDVMLASVGIGPDDTAAWRFVEDPHLFTVFATRAREQFTVFVSADPPAGGLFADYLAQSDDPPGPPGAAHDDGAPDPWSAAVAADLRTAGAIVATAYPVGRHVVDVCINGRRVAYSVECAVHPRGPAAHVDRHLSLRRLGWEITEAYRSRWAGRRGELAVELAAALDLPPPPPPPQAPPTPPA